MTNSEAVNMLMNSQYYSQGYKQGASDVLDKVRAEVKSMDFDFGDYYDHTSTIIEMMCEVIDKYKPEGSDKE